ncbi:DUF4129 domain-containing protein [Arthrobacter sp. SA17]
MWRLERAANVFDAVRYGHAPVDQQDFADMVELDESIAGLQPDFKGAASHTLALPCEPRSHGRLVRFPGVGFPGF